MIVTLHATGHHCRHETPTRSSAGWAAGEKYRVTANYAVIYDAEQPTEELGRMNRSNRFEVIGKTGNRLVLNHRVVTHSVRNASQSRSSLIAYSAGSFPHPSGPL